MLYEFSTDRYIIVIALLYYGLYTKILKPTINLLNKSLCKVFIVGVFLTSCEKLNWLSVVLTMMMKYIAVANYITIIHI